MVDWADDPVVLELRERITAADEQILESVNRRIELVDELRRHKEARGYPFLDPDREERLLNALAERNPGPLSEEGLRELFAAMLDLVKREVASERAGGRR